MAKFKNAEGQELGLDDILQDSEYQAEFDKKIAKALEKNQASIDAEVNKKLEAAIAAREEEMRKNIQEEIDAKAKEAEENAKLSEAEKYKKMLDQTNQKLADYENRIAISDREAKMKKYIKEKGYDADAILDLVSPASVTDANYETRIDEINDKLTEKINKAVSARMQDDADKHLGGKGGKQDMPTFDFNFQGVKPAGK